MKQKGMFWHVHHDILLEYCYDYQERVDFIKRCKPADEIETRLRLFKPVKGKLPEAVFKACAACDKARAAYDEACAACDKVIQDNMAEIKVLHERECPNCPWDGKQIVF